MLDPTTGELLAADRNGFFIPGNIYTVGSTGPVGGIVFYVSEGGLHGLEAAPVDFEASWGCQFTLFDGADGTAIGTGAQNTADILAGCDEPGIAAALTDAYSLNGFSDWFLPSIRELRELYLNRAVVGSFGNSIYLSSSEVEIGGAGGAAAMNFDTGREVGSN